MPPKVRITKQEIVDVAVALVRTEGEDALNARRIAQALGCSTQPIFSNFANMEELRQAVKTAAYALYASFLQTDMAAGKYPPYKASGMAYIRFAREEKELFWLLFMCDRSGERIEEDRESIRALLEQIMHALHVDEDTAYRFHMEMWVFVHGIATMIATSYLCWDEAMTSDILTDVYRGLTLRYREMASE